jgi:hypothetical protein
MNFLKPDLNMKNKIIPVSVALLLACLFSCQEIYNDPSIKSASGIIVVKGLITDAEGPYSVYVSHTIPFNDAEPSVYADTLGIADAEVVISDDHGNSEVLSETTKGHYVTSAGGIRGTAGYTYTLSITTPDGNSYQSAPCLLKPAPVITSVYPVRTEELVLVNNLYGVPTLVKEEGVAIFADLDGLSDDDTYYRFDLRIIREKREVYFMGPSIYCWTTSHINSKENLISTQHLSGNSITGQHITFLTPDIYPPGYSPAGSNSLYLDGRIVALDIYTVSRKVYDYYSSFYNQLSAENRIFDPIPTNLTGNIYSINNHSEPVMGIFEASGKNYGNCLVKYNQGNDNVLYQDAGYMPPDISQGCNEYHKPEFYQIIGL